MKFKDASEIAAVLKPTAEEMGIEIVEVEAKITKNPYITVYIDTESGVDLDTCEKFHNAIDSVLDEFDPSFGASYTLNVSSPGLDRPLKTERDFLKRIGKDVEIKLFAPIRGKKYFEAKLVSYDGKNVVIEENGETITLPLSRISKINEAVKFD
ncbi:MAG TPA: ribosome maturation factor RimP [Clostridiales bacterium]|nr:ribosome maturation factor RimP [Clostridiales bacterium]